jgi:hypothetical protein
MQFIKKRRPYYATVRQSFGNELESNRYSSDYCMNQTINPSAMDPAFYTSIDVQPIHTVSGWNHGRTIAKTSAEGIVNGNDDPTCVVGVTDLAEDFLESSNISHVSS